jgi:hypothetical protein
MTSKTENLTGEDIDISFVSTMIPLFMNSLYNTESFSSVNLEEIRDAFRLKQIQSKSWLIENTKDFDKNKSVLVIGSWLGFTSLCLHHAGFKKITETDPDVRLMPVATHLNRFCKNFQHLSEDINNIEISNYEIIINTSCEHIQDNSWFEKIRPGTKLILHSNNLIGYDHVNICEDVEEMIKKYPMKLSYSGCLDLKSYKRFMLIGEK